MNCHRFFSKQPDVIFRSETILKKRNRIDSAEVFLLQMRNYPNNKGSRRHLPHWSERKKERDKEMEKEMERETWIGIERQIAKVKKLA